MNLLLFNNDERLLLDYLTKDGSVICGLYLKNGIVDTLTIDEIGQLGHDEPLTFFIFNPSVGKIVTIEEGNTIQLSPENEYYHTKNNAQFSKDKDSIIDIFLSPVLIYRRPYIRDNICSGTKLEPATGEVSLERKKWKERIYNWCMRKGIAVYSWKLRNKYPGQLHFGTVVDTQYAFPDALQTLENGQSFCLR